MGVMAGLRWRPPASFDGMCLAEIASKNLARQGNGCLLLAACENIGLQKFQQYHGIDPLKLQPNRT